MNKEQAQALRAPFPKSAIGKIPKAGMQLDYVGHAAVTSRLLEVDPEWSWEPFSVDEQGLPALDYAGGLWIRLTVGGVTRIGYGQVDDKSGDKMKKTVSDALRNAAMRFGVALDLWSKEEIHTAPTAVPVPATDAPGDGSDVLAVLDEIRQATTDAEMLDIAEYVKSVQWDETDLQSIRAAYQTRQQELA